MTETTVLRFPECVPCRQKPRNGRLAAGPKLVRPAEYLVRKAGTTAVERHSCPQCIQETGDEPLVRFILQKPA